MKLKRALSRLRKLGSYSNEVEIYRKDGMVVLFSESVDGPDETYYFAKIDDTNLLGRYSLNNVTEDAEAKLLTDKSRLPFDSPFGIDLNNYIELPTNDLRWVLRAMLGAASGHHYEARLRCLAIDMANGTFASSDGHRLHLLKGWPDDQLLILKLLDSSGIVTTSYAVARFLQENFARSILVSTKKDDQHTVLLSKDEAIYSRSDRAFPNYRSVIPSQTEPYRPTRELINMLKATRAKFVKLSFNKVGGWMCFLDAQYNQVSGRAQLPGTTFPGYEKDILLNRRYLVDALRHGVPDQISFGPLSADAPCMIEFNNATALIMPVNQKQPKQPKKKRRR